MTQIKIKKSIRLTAGIALYFIAMSLYFGPKLIAEGHGTKFWISVAFEIVLIVALFFALRRKDKLKQRWHETDDKD